jgi:hypothetical protein
MDTSIAREKSTSATEILALSIDLALIKIACRHFILSELFVMHCQPIFLHNTIRKPYVQKPKLVVVHKNCVHCEIPPP